MTQVIDITASYLKEHDYDGLVNGELECGCGLDDLAPCESNSCTSYSLCALDVLKTVLQKL